MSLSVLLLPRATRNEKDKKEGAATTTALSRQTFVFCSCFKSPGARDFLAFAATMLPKDGTWRKRERKGKIMFFPPPFSLPFLPLPCGRDLIQTARLHQPTNPLFPCLLPAPPLFYGDDVGRVRRRKRGGRRRGIANSSLPFLSVLFPFVLRCHPPMNCCCAQRSEERGRKGGKKKDVTTSETARKGEKRR